MSAEDVKTYREKISAQLQQVKTRLKEVEAHGKGELAHAEADLLSDVNSWRQEIEEKLHEMKTTGGANADQVKADIDKRMARLNSSLTELASKVKRHAKAS